MSEKEELPEISILYKVNPLRPLLRACVIMYLLRNCKRFFDHKTPKIIVSVIGVLKSPNCPTLSVGDPEACMSKGSFTLSKSDYFSSICLAAQCKH